MLVGLDQKPAHLRLSRTGAAEAFWFAVVDVFPPSLQTSLFLSLAMSLSRWGIWLLSCTWKDEGKRSSSQVSPGELLLTHTLGHTQLQAHTHSRKQTHTYTQSIAIQARACAHTLLKIAVWRGAAMSPDISSVINLVGREERRERHCKRRVRALNKWMS